MRLRRFAVLSVILFAASCYFFPFRVPPVLPAVLGAAALTAGLSGRKSSAASLVIAAAVSAGAAVSVSRGVPDPGEAAYRNGIWSGRIVSGSSSGVMFSSSGTEFWVTSRTIPPGSMSGDSIRLLGRASGRFITPFAWDVFPSRTPWQQVRRWLCSRWSSAIPSRETLALVEALLAGERSGITPALRALFRQSGTSHLLAVSGMHTGLVAGILLAVAGRWMKRSRWTVLPVIAGLAAFTFVSGARVSTVRAALMCSAALLLPLGYGGKADYAGIWATVLLVMVLLFPGILEDRGAQLSFTAVLALIVFARRFGGRFGAVLTALHAGLTVTLVTAPLIATVYGSVALHAPLATALSLPFVIAVMSLGVVVLVPVLSTGASVLLEWTVWVWMRVMGSVALPLLSPRGAVWLPAWSAAVALLWLGGRWSGSRRMFR